VEGIAVIVGIVILWNVIKALFGSSSSKSSHEAIGPLEARLNSKLLDEADKNSPLVKEIEVKGLLPLDRKRNIGFVTSIFDNTSGEYEFVISAMDQFQEPHTRAYQYSMGLGPIEPGISVIKWMRTGVVLPQILETPYGGARKLVALLRLIDLDNKPEITLGFHKPDQPGLIWQRVLEFDYTIEGRGYVGTAKLREDAAVLCVLIATGLVVRDGAIDAHAGEMLQSWMRKILESAPANRRDALRSSLNNALKKAYSEIRSSTYSVTDYVRQLNAIEESALKYQVIELCFDVMAEKGPIVSRHVKIISLIARALNLDLKEIEKIKDIKIIGPSTGSSDGITQMLGIDPAWDREEIRKHLRDQFRKWNNRITTLPQGGERANAQKMLDAIAEARRKYD
jgi:hypothetical protein